MTPARHPAHTSQSFPLAALVRAARRMGQSALQSSCRNDMGRTAGNRRQCPQSLRGKSSGNTGKARSAHAPRSNTRSSPHLLGLFARGGEKDIANLGVNAARFFGEVFPLKSNRRFAVILACDEVHNL